LRYFLISHIFKLLSKSKLHLLIGLPPSAPILLARWLRSRPIFWLLLLCLFAFTKAILFINSALGLDIFETWFIQHGLIFALNPLPMFLYLSLSCLLSGLYHVGSLSMSRYYIGHLFNLRWHVLSSSAIAAIAVFLGLLLEL